MSDASSGGAPDGAPPDLVRLVRRDVRVTAVGLIVAASCVLLLVAAGVDVIGDRSAETAVVALSLMAGFGCFVWWLAGPREYRGDRVAVLAPLFLLAVPGLLSLYDLGGGLAGVLASSLVGFSAAIAGGLALASRRAR